MAQKYPLAQKCLPQYFFDAAYNTAPTITITQPTANPTNIAPLSNRYLQAHAADSDGTISKVEFFANGTLLASVPNSTGAGYYEYTWTSVPAGSYTITAKATDNLDGTKISDPKTLIANTVPTVSLTSPANNATADAPGSFTLTANAADADGNGTITKVEFYANNGTNTLVGTITAAPYTFAWNNVAAGNYSLTAKVTDNVGATATSSPVAVVVNVAVPTSTQAYYIHTDHLDTPRQITDISGNVVWQWDNVDPFGNNTPAVEAITFNLRFPGQYYDKETNTHYNINRDYDPAIGRYVQSDPIGLGGGINTYGYANQNPLIFSDFTGLAPNKFCTTDSCVKIVDIQREYSGFCPGGCFKVSGFFQLWSCWPYTRFKEPMCVCGRADYPRG